MVWGGYLLRTATSHRLFTLAFVINGALILLIGASYIPLYLGVSSAGGVGAAYDLHVAAAVFSFILSAIVAISSYRVIRGQYRYFGLVLGLVALAAFSLFGSGNYLGLGSGGMERMIIYPTTLWLAGLSTYLLGGRLD